MKFCPECGNKLIENAKFCPECGFKIASINNNSQKNRRSGCNREGKFRCVY